MADDGGLNTSFVPRKEVIASDTQPDSPSDGLWWLDTSGASNTIKYYNGSSFTTSGNTIDGVTIVEDKNGDLKVNQPLALVIGDWEQSKDGWSVNNNQMFRYDDGSVAGSVKYGDYALSWNSAEPTPINMSITVDVTGYSVLKVPYAGDTDDDIDIVVDGTTEVNGASATSNYEWETFEISVRTLSGDIEIEIVINSFGNNDILFDKVAIEKPIPTEVADNVV